MKVEHQPNNRRFELIDEKNHRWGEMNYILREDTLNITHVGVMNLIVARASAIFW